MRAETAGSVTQNVPPKPQQSSGRSRGTRTRPLTCVRRSAVLLKGGGHDPRGLRQFQATNGAAAVVQSHCVRELRPGEVMDLHDVVQKLDQLVGVLTHMLHGI